MFLESEEIGGVLRVFKKIRARPVYGDRPRHGLVDRLPGVQGPCLESGAAQVCFFHRILLSVRCSRMMELPCRREF
jgi:hypothetical protein